MNIFDILKLINSLSEEEKKRIASLKTPEEVKAMAAEYGLTLNDSEAKKALEYIKKYKGML